MASGGSPASRKSRIARGVKAVVRDPKAVSRLWRRGDVSLSAGELSGFRDADGQESRIFFVVGFPKSGTISAELRRTEIHHRAATDG